MSDVTEIYERTSVLDDFKKIIKDSAIYWKNPPSETFMDAMAVKMLQFIGPYKDKLKDAIRVCVDNQSSFPSIRDLQEAVAVVRKKPIDYSAAQTIDARVKGCSQCSNKDGYVRMMKGELDYMAFCTCGLGQKLHSLFANRGVISMSELERSGFVTFRKWRERR